MADSGKRVIVDGVEFGRVWLFPRILTSITSSMQPARMIIALFMVVLLIALGRLWDRSTDPNVHPDGLMQGRFEHWLDDGAHQQALLRVLAEFARDRIPPAEEIDNSTFDARQTMNWVHAGYLKQRSAMTNPEDRQAIEQAYSRLTREVERTRPRGDFEATVDHVIASFRMLIDGALDLEPRAVVHAADQLLIQTPKALWAHQTWFAVVFGLATLIVLAIGGGAIARIAAVQQSTEQRLGLSEATDFAISRAGSLVAAQLWPLLVTGLLAVMIMAFGFFMRFPVVDVLLALFYFLGLLLGFLMAFLVVGYVIGHPMLAPAVACENCDGADAMQRTYAYVVNRPLHAIWYWVVAVFGLAIGFGIASAIAYLTINLTGSAFAALAADSPAAVAGGYQPGEFRLPHDPSHFDAWHERWAANLIGVWQSLIICLLAAYVISYHFSVSTIAYLLMRKASDGQETDEIWRPGLVPGTQAPEFVPKAMTEP